MSKPGDSKRHLYLLGMTFVIIGVLQMIFSLLICGFAQTAVPGKIEDKSLFTETYVIIVNESLAVFLLELNVGGLFHVASGVLLIQGSVQNNQRYKWMGAFGNIFGAFLFMAGVAYHIQFSGLTIVCLVSELLVTVVGVLTGVTLITHEKFGKITPKPKENAGPATSTTPTENNEETTPKDEIVEIGAEPPPEVQVIVEQGEASRAKRSSDASLVKAIIEENKI